MLDIFINAGMIAVVAVVFTCILVSEGMVFGFWEKILDRLPDELAYPLGKCPYCFGGQIALWYYFFIEEYNIVHHIYFISLTILFIHLIFYLYERTNT